MAHFTNHKATELVRQGVQCSGTVRRGMARIVPASLASARTGLAWIIKQLHSGWERHGKARRCKLWQGMDFKSHQNWKGKSSGGLDRLGRECNGVDFRTNRRGTDRSGKQWSGTSCVGGEWRASGLLCSGWDGMGMARFIFNKEALWFA